MMSPETKPEITRRVFLNVAGAGVVSTSLGLILPQETKASTQTDTLEQLDPKDRALVEAAIAKFSEDDIGLRISNPFVYKGMRCVAFQGAILQEHPKLGLVLLNSMDEFKQYDPYFELYYQVPPHEDFSDGTKPGETDKAFQIRVRHFGIDADIAEWAQNKRKAFEIGVPTSSQKKYGPFTMVRFQRYVVQRVDEGPEQGQIRRVLVGDIIKNIGRTIVDAQGNAKTIPGPKIIPDEALLPEPEKRDMKEPTQPTPTESLRLKPSEVAGIMPLACPVERKLCNTGRPIADNPETYGLGFMLPKGTEIKAVMDGILTDQPKPEGRSPNQPLLYLHDNKGNMAFYSFYGTVPRSPQGRVKQGEIIGIIGEGQFPNIPPFTGLNFYFALTSKNKSIEITPADLSDL